MWLRRSSMMGSSALGGLQSRDEAAASSSVGPGGTSAENKPLWALGVAGFKCEGVRL